MIENATFPHKNVKINRIGIAKWTCQRKWSFAINYYIFFKICFSLRTSYKEFI